jgi:hypothetical protein
MATCPRCRKDTLETVQTLALGPDDYNDEYTFKTFHCTSCPLVGVGYYEESRRGSSARWHHRGYETNRADYDMVNADLARCLAQSNAHCACEVHQKYRGTGGSHAALRLVTIGDELVPLG